MNVLRDTRPRHGQRCIVEHFGPGTVWAFTSETPSGARLLSDRWTLHAEYVDTLGRVIPEAWVYALGSDRWAPAEAAED